MKVQRRDLAERDVARGFADPPVHHAAVEPIGTCGAQQAGPKDVTVLADVVEVCHGQCWVTALSLSSDAANRSRKWRA